MILKRDSVETLPTALQGQAREEARTQSGLDTPSWQNISLWDTAFGANTERFQGLAPLLPHLCPLSVPKGGVCGVYLESP